MKFFLIRIFYLLCFIITREVKLEDLHIIDHLSIAITGIEFDSIDPKIFLVNKNIEVLKIHNTSIKEIPQEIELLKNLVCFYYEDNIYTVNTQNLSKLCPTYLESLILSNIRTKLDLSFIGKFQQLTKLKIEKCMLTELPDDICKLTNLTEFAANNNLITKLPKSFGSLFKLEKCFLSHNNLKDLCFSFLKLQNLILLDLNYNKFEIIPLEVTALEKLSQLSMTNNLITRITHTKDEIYAFKVRFAKSDLISIMQTFFMDCVSYTIIRLQEVFMFSFLLGEYITKENCEIMLKYQMLLYKNGLFNAKNLAILILDDNRIKEIPPAISRLNSLIYLSICTNDLTNFPAELQYLPLLNSLKLADNYIKYLPFDLELFRNKTFNIFDLECNEIPIMNTENGLGIVGIKEINFKGLSINYQFSKATRMENVIRKMESKPLYWNLSVIREIKVNTDFTSKIAHVSDKCLRKIFRKIIKYFVYDVNADNDEDSVSSEENDDFLNEILKSDSLEFIKSSCNNTVFDDNLTNDDDSLRKRVSTIIRDSCGYKSKENNLIKGYLKVIFLAFLEKIKEADGRKQCLLLLKNEMTELMNSSLIMCIQGKLEGLKRFYVCYCLGDDSNDLQGAIKSEIARLKEDHFAIATLEDNEQSVHILGRWKNYFKDTLGVQFDIEDPYTIHQNAASRGKRGVVLEKFFNLFSVKKVSQEILNLINGNKEFLGSAFQELYEIVSFYASENKTRILSENEKYDIWLKTIKLYFEHDEDVDITYEYKKLKLNGLHQILIQYKIIMKKHKNNE